MNGLLFLLIALGVLAIVATIRELPNDGFRARAVDLAQLQHLRDREEREAWAAPQQAAAPARPAAHDERLASSQHVAASRREMHAVRSRRS